MKYVLILLVFLIYTSVVFAQVEKNTTITMEMVPIVSCSIKYQEVTIINTTPVLVLINDNLMIRIRPGFHKLDLNNPLYKNIIILEDDDGTIFADTLVITNKITGLDGYIYEVLAINWTVSNYIENSIKKQ